MPFSTKSYSARLCYNQIAGLLHVLLQLLLEGFYLLRQDILLLLGEQLEQHDIVLLRNQLKSQLLRLLEHRRIGMLSGDHVPEQPLPAGRSRLLRRLLLLLPALLLDLLTDLLECPDQLCTRDRLHQIIRDGMIQEIDIFLYLVDLLNVLFIQRDQGIHGTV